VALRFGTTRRREDPIFETHRAECIARLSLLPGSRDQTLGTALATFDPVGDALVHQHTVLSQPIATAFRRDRGATARAGPRTNA
jgi:hypothetical protein